MAKAIVFPGQGSQAVGMGKDLADAFTVAKEVFLEVDDALSENLSKKMFEGPAEDLLLTENAQPALMAVSMAVVRVLQQEGKISLAEAFKYAAGHSLGEYSALCAAGAFDVTTAARLLRTRGKAMQQAVPVGQGGMAALIGADLEQAKEVAAEAAQGDVCVAANDNAPGQVVLSGTTAAIDRAVEIAAKKGIKRAVKLAVSAPFHSPMMQPAADVMAEALAAVRIKTPRFPVIANVTARPVTAGRAGDGIRPLAGKHAVRAGKRRRYPGGSRFGQSIDRHGETHSPGFKRNRAEYAAGYRRIFKNALA